MGESKKRINSMLPHITQAGTQGSTKLPEYGVCSSYTEYRHYKKSAAKAAVADLKMSGISNAADGLVQAIADNFDADTSSQNGRQSTHSLAILLTQYSQAPQRVSKKTTQESEGSPMIPLRFLMMLISTGTSD